MQTQEDVQKSTSRKLQYLITFAALQVAAFLHTMLRQDECILETKRGPLQKQEHLQCQNQETQNINKFDRCMKN